MFAAKFRTINEAPSHGCLAVARFAGFVVDDVHLFLRQLGQISFVQICQFCLGDARNLLERCDVDGVRQGQQLAQPMRLGIFGKKLIHGQLCLDIETDHLWFRHAEHTT